MDLPIKIQIPEKFYRAEIRYDYQVSEEIKKVWAVQLDLLHEFMRICEKHSLRWFLGFGSLLGVVRHKGYIPWDNDIDVVMPREDYDKLLKIGEDEFKHPYFFQNPQTENGRFFFMFSRLSNSMTTGASPEHWSSRMNCGMYMDIYPLDYLPNGRLRRIIYLSKLKNISYMARFAGTFYRLEKTRVSEKLKMLIHYIHYRVIGSPNSEKVFAMYNNRARSYYKKSHEVGCVILGYKPTWTWNVEDWNDYEIQDFEMFKVRIPKGYHNILTKTYGDYMKVPDDKNTHEYILFEAELPYAIYFSKYGYAYK